MGRVSHFFVKFLPNPAYHEKVSHFLSKKFDKFVGRPQTAILQKIPLSRKPFIFKRPRKSHYVPLCPDIIEKVSHFFVKL